MHFLIFCYKGTGTLLLLTNIQNICNFWKIIYIFFDSYIKIKFYQLLYILCLPSVKVSPIQIAKHDEFLVLHLFSCLCVCVFNWKLLPIIYLGNFCHRDMFWHCCHNRVTTWSSYFDSLLNLSKHNMFYCVNFGLFLSRPRSWFDVEKSWWIIPPWPHNLIFFEPQTFPSASSLA